MSVAWLFPGQGSQSVGMCKDVFDASPAARAVLERVDAALGESLSMLIVDGPEERLTLTANAQPAIVATSCAVLEAMRERVPNLPAPTVAAGHSLGEYSALVAAGALALEDAVRLVRARGRAMQDAVPPGTGAMVAVMGLDRDQVEAVCREAAQGEVVGPANFNAPGQVVVAGHAGAVGRVTEAVALLKGRAISLKVSAPFHCALMAPAARIVEEELKRIAMLPSQFPVVANFDGRPNSDPTRTKELLIRQVDGAVRWEDTIRQMASAGVTRALEIGPGKVLAGLAKRTSKDVSVLSVSDLSALDRVAGFLGEAS